MLARNHEVSGFASTCLLAALAGVPPVGSIALGVLGAAACDLPDLDHPSAAATRALRWVPYWRDHPRDDKTGDYKRSKDGRIKTEVRYFPALQVHGFLCWLSGAIYDRCATDLDRADTNKMWGPAFRVHRGFTHSVWFGMVLGLITWVLAAPWPVWDALSPLFGATPLPVLLGYTVCTGCLTHIAGDGCTDFGVAPFAPLWKWKGRRYVRMGLWTPLRFKVSKGVEKILIAPLCGLLACYAAASAFIGPQLLATTLWDAVASVWQNLA